MRLTLRLLFPKFPYTFMSVLLFGFGKFSDYEENPSEIVVSRLNNSVIRGHKIIGKILPVEFERVEKIIVDNISNVKPRLVLGIGLAPGRTKITPEKIAINYKYSREPDNSGVRYMGERIDPSQPDGVFSDLPVEGLVNYLNEEGIPAELSLSAGGYLCNMAMFIILRECKKVNSRGGFIHIPCHERCAILSKKDLPSMSMETIVRGITLSIEYYLKSPSLSFIQETPNSPPMNIK
jgi:pyroglutamyl-peptidase